MRKKIIHLLVILLVCSVFFSACSGESKVLIRISPTEYTTDVETIDFEVVNNSWREITFGNYYDIQKKAEDDTWETIPTTGKFGVTDIGHILKKGKSSKFTANIKERFSHLEAREYRIAFEVSGKEAFYVYGYFTVIES